MKSLKLTLLAVIASFSFAVAQPQMGKAVIKTPTVQCEACKERIENRLQHEEGMSSIVADYKKHTVTVVWYKDRTNIENIKTALANLGYDADDVAAEPDSYKLLPKTCQHVIGGKPLPKKD
jgi:periplasmic mercuric ion binding protein